MLAQTFAYAALLCLSSAAFGQTALSLDWQWKKSHQCSGTSPALAVGGLPEGTRSISVTMVDLDVPSYDHGGGSVAHAGGASASIAEGALKNYRGPCPPNFSSFGHDYEFSVRALAEDGKTVLAQGRRKQTFSAQTAK